MEDLFQMVGIMALIKMAYKNYGDRETSSQVASETAHPKGPHISHSFGVEHRSKRQGSQRGQENLLSLIYW